MVRYLPDPPDKSSENQWFQVVGGPSVIREVGRSFYPDLQRDPASYLEKLTRLPHWLEGRPEVLFIINLWCRCAQGCWSDKIYTIYIMETVPDHSYSIRNASGGRNANCNGGLPISALRHPHGFGKNMEEAVLKAVQLAKKKLGKKKAPYRLIGLWSKEYNLGEKAAILLEVDYSHAKWGEILKDDDLDLSILQRVKGLIIE